ncbi:MAG: hypothetical protein KatS3mg129_1344 [Leptospiraceae bacterium]|nr:MAG: hypothetical protein KatS3mg129_1344 [Leptospiraceae bacterium]
MNKKTLKIQLLILIGVLGLTYCKQLGLSKEDDNKDKEKLALSLLLLNKGGQEVIPAAAVSRLAVSAAQSAAQGNSSVYNIENTKEFFLACKKNKLKQKFPYLKLTAISPSNGTCTHSSGSYNCNATLNGTANCIKGGTVTFNNVQVNMTGTYPSSFSSGGNVNYSSNINGNISFDNCKTLVDANYDFVYEEVTINGSSTVNISNNMNGTFSYNSSNNTMTSNYIFTDSGSVSVSNFSINGQSIGNQDYNVDTNITANGNYSFSYSSNPPTYTSTFNFDYTLNGYVKINNQTIKEFNNTKVTRSCTSTFNTDTSESSYSCN